MRFLPKPGDIFHKKYRVVGKLGEGGFAIVYRVEHIRLAGKHLALKLMLPEQAQDEGFRKRFLREVEVVMGLVHPHIIPIRDFDETDEGHLYYTMDYSPGEPLSNVIARERVIAPERALILTRQMLLAFGAAHAMGIVHRDVKPGNMMVETDASGGETVRVLDFGIAKLKGGGENLTAEGLVVGTPQYMAPEQGLGKPLDGRSDLYAVGLVLFEMLAGRLPFEAKSALGWVAQHVQAPVPAMREIAPDVAVPPEIEAVVRKALEKDPDARYQTAEEFARAIDGVLQNKRTMVGLEAPKIEPKTSALIPPTATHEVPKSSPAVARPRETPTKGLNALTPSADLSSRADDSKEGAPPALLLAGPDGQRIFLFAAKSLSFGRAKADPAKGREGADLLLRVLPCRSEREDPENWSLTRKLSGVHGVIGFDVRGPRITDKSSHGTWLNGKRLDANTAMPLPDRFTLGLAEDALVLEGVVFRSRTPPAKDAAPSSRVGLQDSVDAVVLHRPKNVPEHSYVLVRRAATLGGGEVPIRVLPKAAVIVARMLFHQGKWHIQRSPEVSPDAVKVAGAPLAGSQPVPVEAVAVEIAGTAWQFRPAEAPDFSDL